MSSNRPGNRVVVLGALLLAVVCWGLAPVANRYLLSYFSPLQVLLLRFLLSTLLFLPLLVRVRIQRWTKGDIGLAVVCGIVSVLGYNVAATFGLRWIPAEMAGLLLATEPIWIALLAIVFLRERLHWSIVAGFLLATGGVGLLIGWSAGGLVLNGTVLAGSGLVLLGAITWSIYTIAARPLSRKYGAQTCTSVTIVAGSLPLFALWDGSLLTSAARFTLPEWAALALLALGSTVIATIFWNYGVARLQSSQAGLFLYLIPLVSVAGGVVLLHEQMSARIVVSGLFIVGGVVLAQVQHLPRKSVRLDGFKDDQVPGKEQF